MPRVKPLIRPDPRAAAVSGEISELLNRNGITKKDLSRRTGIEYQRLCRMLRNIGTLTMAEYWAIQDCTKGGCK